MEKPSRDARRASPDPVLVVDVHGHAGIPRAMLKSTPAGSGHSACHSTKGEREEEGGSGGVEGEGDLEEVPRDGETREARAEDGVPQGTAAVLSCRRGRGSGCDGSPGVEGEAGKQTGRSRGRHGVRLSGHWAWNL